ncbi:MAG: hypothetical protein JWL84_2481 [Rhodospirillales bacterium]|nr:hypothetical protein [Rhodospirillales bacterium]
MRDRLLAAEGVVMADLPIRHQLFGRVDEVAQLATGMQSILSIIVRGVGGIGKTQLVLAAADAAQSARPLVWIALEDCPSEAVLAAYLEAAAGRISEGDSLRTFSSARACVVLDGIERAGCGLEAVSNLISRLTSDGLNIQVVVTSQVRLPEIAFGMELELGKLDETSSALILPSPARGQRSVPRLLEFADGHPLTLRIIAALVRHFDDAEEVLTRLRGSARPIEMPARSRQGAGSSLDLCLGAAFAALNMDERAAMWAIAQFPAGLATAFVDLGSLGFEDAPALTAGLRRWHLLEVGDLWGGSLLSMLSPIRDFVRRTVDEQLVHGLGETRRRLAFVVAARIREADSDLIHGGRVKSGKALFDRELPNALAVMEIASSHAAGDAGYRVLAIALASNLQTYLFSAGYFDVGAEVMRKAADLAIAAGRPREALEMISQLVSLANRGERFELVRAALEDARALNCKDDPFALALLLGIEANAERPRGDGWQGGGREELLRQAASAARSYELLVEAAGRKLTHRAALALLQQGCILEDAGNPGGALPLLERACAYFLNVKDPINAGAALQRRGNCLAYAGRYDDAMDSYADGAIQFHPLAAVDYRSNTLGEAGLLMAEHHRVTCSPKITLDITMGGVDDIVDQIVGVVPGIRVPGNDWPYLLTRKACGMISLASLAGYSSAVEHMGIRLREEVSDVLLGRESEEWQAVGGGSLVSAHFSALAWLCEHIANVQPPDRRPDLKEVEGLSIIMEDMFRGEIRDLMFAWLARYLSEQRGLVGLRAGVLRAAVDSLAYGDRFSLDNFDLSN